MPILKIVSKAQIEEGLGEIAPDQGNRIGDMISTALQSLTETRAGWESCCENGKALTLVYICFV